MFLHSYGAVSKPQSSQKCSLAFQLKDARVEEGIVCREGGREGVNYETRIGRQTVRGMRTWHCLCWRLGGDEKPRLSC